MIYDLEKTGTERVIQKTFATKPAESEKFDVFDSETCQLNAQYRWLDDYGWI